MAHAKKTDNKTTVIITLIAACVLIAAVILVFIWAKNSGGDKPDDGSSADDSSTAEVNSDESVPASDSVVDTVLPPESREVTLPAESDTETELPPETVPVYESVTVEHSYSEATGEMPDGFTATLEIDAPKIRSDRYGENVDLFNTLIATEVEQLKDRYALVLAAPEENGGSDISFKMGYEVTKNDSGIISVLLKTENYLGGAHDEIIYKSVNFELNGGKTITLGDILTVDKETYTAFIKDFVLGKMREEPDKYYSTDDAAFDENFVESQFYITSNGITVFFEQYTISPGSEYPPTFEITYADMSSLLAY